MIRLLAIAILALGGAVAAAPTPASAACKVRVATSLISNSERAGPNVPCTARDMLNKSASSARPARTVDPMQLIRRRMTSGEDVSYAQLQKLADSGDDLGAFYLARRIEASDNPDTLDTAGHYYLRALYDGRSAALKPVIRLLGSGAYDNAPANLADAEKILIRLAGRGDGVARDGLIAMYRAGTPFGAHPGKADELLTASAEAGDGKAALDLAIALLAGATQPASYDAARRYLEIAALSEELNVRTMAENLRRNLYPALTANSEIVQ